MIYIVMGETGDCSDYTTWIAKVFNNKRAASRYASALNKIVEAYIDLDYLEQRLVEKKVREFDEKANIQLWVGYKVYKEECLEDLPKALTSYLEEK